MPHTSHRKANTSNKRRQIVDDDGWTRVSSGHSSNHTTTTSLNTPHGLPVLGVANAPKDMTLEKLLQNYTIVEKRWQTSEACRGLTARLRDDVLGGGTPVASGVCFGTGSPSGLTRGWIDRREVALYQIAAFKSIMKAVEKKQLSPILAFAQEPQYNGLDTALLKALGIEQIDDPKGFDLLSSATLVYCPGVERSVLQKAIVHDPDVYVGSRIDLYQDLQLHDYVKDREMTKLPDLDVKDYPFHQMHLYWRRGELDVT